MKKFLTLSAAFMLLGALFVGCIDNTESDGVKAMREAKAALDLARAETIKAHIKLIDAAAALKMAEVDKMKAEIDLAKQAVEREKVEIDMLKAKNQFEKDSLAEVLRLMQAKYEVSVQKELKKLWEAKEAAAKAEHDYLVTLAELEAKLVTALDAQLITELKGVMNQIRFYIAQRDRERDKALEVQAEIWFYQNVDVPTIEQKLDHMIEITSYELQYATWVLDAWTGVKDLAIEKWAAFAQELIAKKGALEQEIVVQKASKVQTEQELAPLTAAKTTADNNVANFKWAPELTNVFGNNGTGKQGTDFPFTDFGSGIFGGVRDGKYSFWKMGTTNWAVEKVAHASVKGYMDKDINFIKSKRIFQTAADVKAAEDMLKKYDDAAKAAKKTYEDGLVSWKTLYNEGTTALGADRIDWASKKVIFDATKAAYQGVYGPAFKKPDLTKFDAIGSPDYKSYGTKIKDAVKEQFDVEAESVECGINTIYTAQRFLIEQYTYVVKTLIAHGSIPGFWLEGDVVISDVIGGISINPNNLIQLILDPTPGGPNFQLLKTIVNFVQTVSACIDIVEMFAALQPSYYPISALYQGAKYVEPIMEKYKVKTPLEFHAWFLLYILFEGNQINIGDNLLVIGSADLPAIYMDVNGMLSKDFLGFESSEYPGAYKFYQDGDVDWATYGKEAHKDLFTAAKRITGPTAVVKDWTVPAAMLKADEALAKAWAKWVGSTNFGEDGVAAKLTAKEKALFSETYARTWKNNGEAKKNLDPPKAPAKVQPYYVSDVAANPRVVVDTTPAFYFQPELYASNVVYPSLVDGADVYWEYPESGYMSIMAWRTALVKVDWAMWHYYGLPTYNDDPVLWNYFNDGPWDNNANLPAADFAKALITKRNYEMYHFWISQQANYANLADKIEAAKATFDTELQKLKDKQTEATNAWKPVNDRLTAINNKITNNQALIAQYDIVLAYLNNSVKGDSWNGYDDAFHAFLKAQEDYNLAVANKAFFVANGGYAAIKNDSTKRNKFVDNVLIGLNSKLERINNKIEEYTIILDALEKQKNKLAEKLAK